MKKYNKGIHKVTRRIVSILTATIMIANIMPMREFSGLFEYLQLNMLQGQKDSVLIVQAYNPSKNPDSFSAGTQHFSDTNISDFIDYCYYYSMNEDDFAEIHQRDVIELDNIHTLSSDFVGLGHMEYPFGGKLELSGSSTFALSAPVALFSYVYDSVTMSPSGSSANMIMQITKSSDTASALFADHVKHDSERTAATWQIEAVSENSNAYGGVIGEMMDDAQLVLEFTNNSSADISANGDAGAICGAMRERTQLTVSYTENNTSDVKIKSTNGSAGGLVGSMESGAKLAMSNIPAGRKTITAAEYAGGLVGDMVSNAQIDLTALNESRFVTSGSVTGGIGAGGLFGHYNNLATTDFDLDDYTINNTVFGQYCGGIFGVLENKKVVTEGESGETTVSETPSVLTIKNTNSNTLTFNNRAKTDSDSYDMSYFGGLIGKYTTDDLKNSLVLDDMETTANAVGSCEVFGGVIGLVDSAAYVKSNGMTVHVRGTDKAYLGGFMGETASENGVFVDLGNFTLNTSGEDFNGGGIVGKFHNGVLCLSGTADMSLTKAASGGQLVGENNNVLVYALGSGTDGAGYGQGWTFKRSDGSEVDDLGTWGEVVHISDIESVLTLDNDNHTVTVPAAVTSISSATDFVKTALNIQLNQGSDYDCLKFTSGNNTRSYLLDTTLSLSDDISLSGTGITGFMRDGGAVSTTGSFTGIFDGNNHTITLATGEAYGFDSSGNAVSASSEGVGQIYRHQHNGLFSVLAGTITNLTIAGTIDVHNCIDGMNIGGIASRNAGNVTLTSVTANETVNYSEKTKITVKGEGKNIGGYIGYVGTDGTIMLNGVNSIGATFNLSGSHGEWNVYGGAIGKITAETFTVNIGTKNDSENKLINSLNTDISGITNVGSNSDSGGLIGYITAVGSYGSRTVNLNNVEFSSCTVGNAASTNGGGFLDYAWLNTSTNVNGVTVTNGTINNSTVPNVGVMLYSSTGKMKVDSLEINELAMSKGGGDSLGMIVNKAYTLNDKNEVNGALYLDVLNTGYDLTGTAAPSQATGVFDEIAAYSAPDVLKGGAGIVSINMNTTRVGTVVDGNTVKLVKITETGTYQNQLKTGDSCANPNARYYYNVDNMSSSDVGQNLVLWSLSKYAYSGIKGEFVTTFDRTLSGAADLTGLSFYPLSSASENYTLENLNLTFAYNGINALDSGTGNTDSYVCDPAGKNQHFLMQSGLFINQAEGTTLTLNSVKLSGDFLEVDDYKGVLVSGTSHGSLSVNGLTLDGIKPNAATGYLLVNHIKREYTTFRAIELLINDVITTDQYTITDANNNKTTAQIAKSLFGTVDGPKIDITLSAMQIDARKANESDAQLAADACAKLNTAYKTVNSIFTTSTFFESINTNASAALIYNYSYDEDWKSDGSGHRKVTYGKEVSESVQWAGKENRYSKNGVNSTQYTDPTKNDNVTNPGYSFASGWLPYVCECSLTKDGNGYYKRELEVNVAADLASEGCGTYNDPYQIKSGTELEKFAKVMYDGDTRVTLILPKSKSSYDDLSKVTSGNRWCNDNHATYTWNQSSTAFTSTENGAESWNLDEVRLYLENAYYLVKNNISLDGGDNGFQGLGGDSSGNDNTGKYAFRGVIVGEKNTDDTPKWTITNNSDSPLVNISNGCVIKDINIVQKADISLTQKENAYNKAYFRYKDYTQKSGDDEGCAYYGGFIGEIMGGDNIIDNSYVSYKYQEAVTTGEGDDAVTTMEDRNATVTLQGSNGTIVPVGGYVGVVVFGGLIFKNMDARKTTVSSTGLNVTYQKDNNSTAYTYNLADNSGQEAWTAIYVNPIVGRVINGYAVNETGGNALNADGNSVQQFSVTEDGKYHDENRTSGRSGNEHTLKNGAKHYSIADIDPSLGKLDVTPPASTTADGTINVPNAQAMFILSLITQSTSGTAQTADGNYQNSLSYGIYSSNVYGMSHNAEYTNVGSATAVTDTDYVSASEDTADNTAVPYIIREYTKETTSRTEVLQTGTIILDDYENDPNGKLLYISNKRGASERYIQSTIKDSTHLKNPTDINNAQLFLFTRIESGEHIGSYTISYDDNGTTKYLYLDNTKLAISEMPDYFNISYTNNIWLISDAKINNVYINNNDNAGFTWWKDGYNDAGNRLYLTTTDNVKLNRGNVISQTEIPVYETVHYPAGYPARCVTSTLGYYDINLTGTDYVCRIVSEGLVVLGIMMISNWEIRKHLLMQTMAIVKETVTNTA